MNGNEINIVSMNVTINEVSVFFAQSQARIKNKTLEEKRYIMGLFTEQVKERYTQTE